MSTGDTLTEPECVGAGSPHWGGDQDSIPSEHPDVMAPPKPKVRRHRQKNATALSTREATDSIKKLQSRLGSQANIGTARRNTEQYAQTAKVGELPSVVSNTDYRSTVCT